MESKYGINFPNSVVEQNVGRLTNQIWKLIPMRENNEDWRSQIDRDIIELLGMYEIFDFDTTFLAIVTNLEGLKSSEVEFEIYRSKVFESITLLRECVKDASRRL